ncbi:MAG: hypothetical protein KC619_32695 [Myxococcales bacterium]|nr:hypothetical protein [Myxococcales bacterium]
MPSRRKGRAAERLLVAALASALVAIAGCEQRVHVTATLEVAVRDPAGMPVAGAGVAFRSIKIVDGAELARSEFMFSRATGSDGRTSFEVGYNVDSSEDILLQAWTGDATNLDAELITGPEAQALAGDVGFTAITRSVVLTECPMDAPSFCDGACIDSRNDRMNCGGCGVICPVDCLDSECIPCSNGNGTWTLGGDCPVASCVVAQTTCGGTITCTDPGGTTATPVAISLSDGGATFSTDDATCTITLSGDTMSGTCTALLLSCDVTGTRTRP